MSRTRRPNKQAKPGKRGKRAAVYVDELLPPEERAQELAAILGHVTQQPQNFAALIIYGSPKSDVTEEVKDAMSVLAEHGIKVTFKA